MQRAGLLSCRAAMLVAALAITVPYGDLGAAPMAALHAHSAFANQGTNI